MKKYQHNSAIREVTKKLPKEQIILNTMNFLTTQESLNNSPNENEKVFECMIDDSLELVTDAVNDESHKEQQNKRNMKEYTNQHFGPLLYSNHLMSNMIPPILPQYNFQPVYNASTEPVIICNSVNNSHHVKRRKRTCKIWCGMENCIGAKSGQMKGGAKRQCENCYRIIYCLEKSDVNTSCSYNNIMCRHRRMYLVAACKYILHRCIVHNK